MPSVVTERKVPTRLGAESVPERKGAIRGLSWQIDVGVERHHPVLLTRVRIIGGALGKSQTERRKPSLELAEVGKLVGVLGGGPCVVKGRHRQLNLYGKLAPASTSRAPRSVGAPASEEGFSQVCPKVPRGDGVPGGLRERGIDMWEKLVEEALRKSLLRVLSHG